MGDVTVKPQLALPARARILVVKWAGLGDLLLATPALRSLRTRYSEARVDVLTSPSAAPLLASSPLVDHVYALDGRTSAEVSLVGRTRSTLSRLRVLARLRHNRYDAVLLLHHLTLDSGVRNQRLLLRWLGARTSAGLDNGRGDFLDLRVADDGFGAKHEADYFAAVAEAVGADPPAAPRGPTLDDLGWSRSATHERSRDAAPRVALHPGSGTYSVARRWPTERFAEVARALHGNHNADILIVHGPDDADLTDHLLSQLGRPEWASCTQRGTSLRDLARQLAGCDLFIGNDSFPMHLASAAGVPVVAIFGPSNADAWGPYVPEAPRRVRVVRRDDLACSPCFYRGKSLGTPQGCPPRPCLTALPAQPVLEAARDLLQASRAARAG